METFKHPLFNLNVLPTVFNFGAILKKYIKTESTVITYSWSKYPEISHKISGHLFEAIDYYLKLSEDFTMNQLKDIIVLIPEIEEHRIKQCIKAIKYKYKEKYHHILSSVIIFGRPSVVDCNKLLLCDGILPSVSALICKELELWLCSKDNLWVINKLKDASYSTLILRYKEEIHGKCIEDYLSSICNLKNIKREKFHYILDNNFSKDININLYIEPKINKKLTILIYATGNCRSLGDLNNNPDIYINDIIQTINDSSYNFKNFDILIIGANSKDQYFLNTLREKINNNIEVFMEDDLPLENFHEKFTHYLYTPTQKNWDCSSRLIRECVAYKKDIIFTPKVIENLNTNFGLKYLIEKFNLIEKT